MVCLSDDLIYSNILELFLVVFLCGSFGFGIPRFAHKPYGRHLSPSARVLHYFMLQRMCYFRSSSINNIVAVCYGITLAEGDKWRP